MSFEDIRYLWLLAIIPFILLVSIHSYRRTNTWLFSFARRKKKVGRFVAHITFLSFSIVCVTVSLTEPKVQYEKTYFNRSGIDIVFGIDVSKSMLAEDVVLPLEAGKLFEIANRLNRARYCALEILSQLHGERIGAYIFASKGIEVVPFTRDYSYCQYILKHINDTEITIPGSDLGEAIKKAIFMFRDSKSQGVKVLILISDGEDITLDKSSLYETARLAASTGIKIYTVGTGMGREVLIPIRSAEGTSISDYYMSEDGSYLKTSLVPDTLKNIASLTGGQYSRISDENTPERLMASVLNSARMVEQTKSTELAWLDLSPLFIVAGLVFFIAGILPPR